MEATDRAKGAKPLRGFTWYLGEIGRTPCSESCDVSRVEELSRRGMVNKNCALAQGRLADL
jgi:hypothetical protein